MQNKIRKSLPIKHVDGRWMYDENRLKNIFRKMSDKRRLKILEKALDYISMQPMPKWHAIASVLDCSYDDAGFWTRRKQLRS